MRLVAGPPGQKTGPKPTFDVDDAVDAAMRRGMDQFTLSGVARELGVSTPSLYRVIESREQLVHLCLARAASRIGFLGSDIDASRSWQEIVREYSAVFWQALEEFPGLASAILSTPGAHSHVQGYLRSLTAALVESGFPGDRDDIEFIVDFVGDTALVTHLGVMAMRSAGPSGDTGLETARRMVNQQASQADAQPVLGVEDIWAERGWLDRKVEFIVAGIESGIDIAPRTR